MRLYLSAFGVVLLASVGQVHACQICIPFPKKSTADYLLEADDVVLAREDPERPFHFKALEALKGEMPEKKIDLFLDSSSRRFLAVNPKASVVLIKKDRVAKKTTWTRIGMSDAEYGPLVREILKSAASWKKDPAKRVDYFSKYLGNKNPQISSLAHLEIARAPYREIKRLNRVLPRETIRGFLSNFRYVEWHALYILLLAQSDDARDQKYILESFRSAARFGTSTRLSAWATASIEIEGAKAIELIESEYLGNRRRKKDEIKEIARALSVHGSNGRTELRDRIVASYKALLVNHPAMTPNVVNDLVAWKRTELADEVAKFERANRKKLKFVTIQRLRSYARSARAKVQGRRSKVESPRSKVDK